MAILTTLPPVILHMLVLKGLQGLKDRVLEGPCYCWQDFVLPYMREYRQIWRVFFIYSKILHNLAVFLLCLLQNN